MNSIKIIWRRKRRNWGICLNDANEVKFMTRALELAARGKGRVSPNPLVGCVVVKKGVVVGEGWHKKFGGAHAEVNALRCAGKKAFGATLYVNLEPCSHFGKTRPCVQAIVRTGVKKVVVAVGDPNPLVSGEGLRELRTAGIEVVVGVCEKEALGLNKFFFKWIKRRMPFVALKAGLSADGKISGQKRKYISCRESLKRVHELRNEFDAVLVGVGTVLADDPRLTCRARGGRNPLRVILDSRLRIPLSARVLREEGRTLVACGNDFSVKKRKALEEKEGVEVIVVNKAREGVCLKKVLAELGKRGVASVLVEGGELVFKSFLEQGLADEVLLFVSPQKIRGKGKRFPKIFLKNASARFSARDLLIKGIPFKAGYSIIFF